MRLTDTLIRALPCPEKGQRTYWDSYLTGFGCRVSQGGTRSFVVQFGADRRFITIGKYHPDILPLATAREQAKRVLAEEVLGKHRPETITFEKARDSFLKRCEEKNRPRTVYDYKRLLNRHFTFGKRPLADIATADIARKIDKIEARAERKYATVIIKAFFNWAYRQGHVEHSVAARLQVHATPSRERTLTDAELRKCLKLALVASTTFESIVALLILTGQRRGEIAALQDSWVASGSIMLPGSITKNGREHRFPIGRLALTVLAERPKPEPYYFPAVKDRFKDRPATIFNSWGSAKATFDRKLNIAPYTLHDLRRTFRTKWAELGITREVAERYINHVSGVHAGIVSVYDRYDYQPRMKEAVKMWEKWLKRLLV